MINKVIYTHLNKIIIGVIKLLAERYAISVENLLLSKGHKCFYNIPIKGKFPDIVALKGKQIIAIEIKKNILEILLAVGQCTYYKEGVNKVYIALPSKEIERLTKTTLSILKKNRIGLIKYNKSAKITIEASNTGIKNNSLINSLERIPEIISKNRADVEKMILDVLTSENDIPMNDIVKAIKINRITAAKYLAVLEAKDIITHRSVGRAKLYSVKR